MVRADVASRKLARAEAWLVDVERLASVELDVFVAERERADLSAFYLLLAIQEAIDLAAHWLADAGWPPADDVGSSFDVLASRGAIAPHLADEMRAVARVRNRIAHGYASIDHRRLYAEIPAGLTTLRAFLTLVAAQLPSG